MTVVYSHNAERQMQKLDTVVQQRIKRYMTKVAALEDPRSLGKALRGNLCEFWSWRIGDYRIIARIYDDILQIEVVRVGHRRDVYTSYPQ